MKLLLDTHILLWVAAGELSSNATFYIENPSNTLLFSPANLWEVVIKSGRGRTDFIVDPISLLKGLLSAGYQELPILSKHTLFVSTLPPLHQDPFDRILLAQAMSEGISLLTSDKILSQYPCPVIFIEK
jgi:PIN domain nuclease of toxin-antitoxin system